MVSKDETRLSSTAAIEDMIGWVGCLLVRVIMEQFRIQVGQSKVPVALVEEGVKLVRECRYGMVIHGRCDTKKFTPLFPKPVSVCMQRKKKTVPEVPRSWRCFHVLFVAALFIRKPTRPFHCTRLVH